MQEVWGSQAGRVTDKSIPSLWRDKHPAIKGLQPPDHHAGKFHPDHKKTPPSNKEKTSLEFCLLSNLDKQFSIEQCELTQRYLDQQNPTPSYAYTRKPSLDWIDDSTT